jgi:glyoxylase I family protein
VRPGVPAAGPDGGAYASWIEPSSGGRSQESASVIAIVSRGDLHLILGGPGSSGARPMPDGRRQEAGGWNRIVLYVDSIDATITPLTNAKARFRNTIEVGPGGKQILVEDPDGNPVELHEAPQK